MIRKSKYTLLINSDNLFLVYNSARNCFFKINKETYDFIDSIQVDNIESLNEDNKNIFNKLRGYGILTTKEEDEDVVNSLRIKNIINSYSPEILGLTIAPTTSCNLRCPYCFEKNKTSKIINKSTCDNIITFVKSHKLTRKVYVTWFGGEPLICAKWIDYLLEGFENLNDIEIGYQSIITNGTLLTKRNWYIFEKYKFHNIQVTFDGEKITHDSKRFYKNGKGTYDSILKNLYEFCKEFPQIDVSIRINVDKKNFNEFMTVFSELCNFFKGKQNLYIYPGIIKNCGSKDDNALFLNNSDIVKMMYEQFDKGLSVKLPERRWNSCGASTLYSYVIGPNGELYKCWEDIGVSERVIGNVSSRKFTNASLMNKYLLFGSHLSSPECWECPILPICSNDCPHDRLENLYNSGERELCSIYKEESGEVLKNIMLRFYKTQCNKNCNIK